MHINLATEGDIQVLAELNFKLIKDEAHRNSMSISELGTRLESWFQTGYSAALFVVDKKVLGYALWRKEDDFIYIRQFYISDHFRGQGYGKHAFASLKERHWSNERLRLDVLINNQQGLSFWRSVGFSDYCLTMECASS